MKLHPFGARLLLFGLLSALVACTGQRTQAEVYAAVDEFEQGAVEDDGILRMRTFDYTDTVRTGGHTFECHILREAVDSLPMVEDTDGYWYADNRYTLTIRRDGAAFFARRFTKAAFASCLSNEFRTGGLLDGMRCDTTLAGLAFAVSVSLPQSDMVEPLILWVEPNGGVRIERDTRAENDFEPEA